MSLVFKVRILFEEMLAAREWGPSAILQDGGYLDKGFVYLYDANRLAGRLLPEVSLHYSQVEGTSVRRFHKLEYVVFRDVWTGPATLPTIEEWLEEHAVEVEDDLVEQAISLLWKHTETQLKPQLRQKAYQGLVTLRKSIAS